MKLWIALLCGALCVPAHAELYKWTDAEGKVHYSDTPPPGGVKKSEKKKLADKPATATMPYPLQQAVKNFPVTLYSFDCGEGCTNASALLKKRGVPHTLVDPKDPQGREELKKATGGEAVAPVLQVGRRVLKGYEESQWNSALDIAGYPSTALMQVTPTVKPKAQPPQAPAITDEEPQAVSEEAPAEAGQN